MAQETITQQEYERQIRDLRLECSEEYNRIDREVLSNQRQYDFIQQQRTKMLTQAKELELANMKLKNERNELARKYNDRRRDLFKQVETLTLPRELSGAVAFRIRQAVESALCKALAEYSGIDLDGIRCNYNYDEEGKIEFMIKIPKHGKAN